MAENNKRDKITVKDESGNEKELTLEGLFDMEDKTYAMLREGDETTVMRVETEQGEQHLVGLHNKDEMNAILDAYEIAVEASAD